VQKDVRAMLRWLWRQPGYRPMVEEIAIGTRDLMTVYNAYLANTLEQLGQLFTDGPLYDAREKWLDGFDCSESHRHRLRQSFAQLEGLRRRREAKLSELPVLLLELRQSCVTAKTPRKFNYARVGAQALLRDLVGRRHPLYLRVADLHAMHEAKRGKKGLALKEAIAVLDQLPPSSRAIWWAMCWTGMGPTEFWGEWHVLPDRVRIRGTKQPGRRWGSEGRDVPLVITPVRPAITDQQFSRVIRKLGTAPRQGRNTFARLLEDAGVPRTRRRQQAEDDLQGEEDLPL
jgi:hypothetical protein